MVATPTPKGDPKREAIDSLRGYVYQIYQSALAWIELELGELLFLEVAEDYAILVTDALEAVQVKETQKNVTINSDEIITSINSFVDLRLNNPSLQIKLRHLTTSKIGKEKSVEHRIGDTPTLESWRRLAKAGDLEPLRIILNASKLSDQTKSYIQELDDIEFREKFLKRIHFDCGAPESKFLVLQLRSKLVKLVLDRGGVNSQVDACLNSILITLMRKAIQKENRYVDRNILEGIVEKATQIQINRAQLEAQNILVRKALAASFPQDNILVASRLVKPRSLDEVPLPAVMANRTVHINEIVSSLTRHGVSWIYGASGVGKTTSAKIAARCQKGNWASINLRGLNAEQVGSVLSGAIDTLTEQVTGGFLVDDFECALEPYLSEILLNLRFMCDRADLLLLFTSPWPPIPDFLFQANLPETIGKKIEEFSEQDISEILEGMDVHNSNWAKYIHLISGGGHPQLAIAAIQNMQNNGWSTEEFRTLNSLFGGNTAIEQVRARTRERLLNELPESGRRLLERLSLKSGGFRRSFVLDMAQIMPPVPDGGIVFDRLIGSWVDQQERDRFALSPLLSNFAHYALTDTQKREINFEIANALIKGPSFDAVEVNSALLAALSGKNTQAIIRLCVAVIGADIDDLKMIAPHLMIFTCMRTDADAYKDDPVANLMLRGAQLLLVCQEETNINKVKEILDCFEVEIENAEDEINNSFIFVLVYIKLLLSEPKFGAIPNFVNLIFKLEASLEKLEKHFNKELLPRELEGMPAIGFMFINQARQIKHISELLPIFNSLNSCEQKLRQDLLKPYSIPYYGVDMLVVGAFLSECNSNTIDPISHAGIFSQLEGFANSWKQIDLAVCCRKYQAIILDEYGGDKDQALSVIDKGLELYGETNSELIRAKAKVLYRAQDHHRSLELSRVLIDGGAPLNETEKVFLGRDAAISAEKQLDYETARRYFLYGSKAAVNCQIPDMEPLRLGLMADAALASWHSGDRKTCLNDFVGILEQLNDIDPKSSLRAAHCHAVCRHVLLWLNQYATGEKLILTDGEETKIFPGIVSNPEPHSEIGNRFITPIELAWYMLAALENNSYVDVGITKNLEKFLPKGPLVEGQFLLTPSKMRKAFELHDTPLFITALEETISGLAYCKEQRDYKQIFDKNNLKRGSLPAPTLDQQSDFSLFTELFVLSYLSNCIFSNYIEVLDQLISELEKGHGLKVREVFLSSLRGYGSESDFNTTMATILFTHVSSINKNEQLLPSQVFKLAIKALQVAIEIKNIRMVTKSAFEWLTKKWSYISKNQRFLLNSLKTYEESINASLIVKGDFSVDNLIHLLQAILPTIGFENEQQIRKKLNEM